MCIRSMECECFAEQDICNAYLILSNDKRFWNIVACPIPMLENWKFTSKHYLKTNMLTNHLQYIDIQELHQLLTDTSKNLDFDSNFAF